jgi:hypothetical protein
MQYTTSGRRYVLFCCKKFLHLSRLTYVDANDLHPILKDTSAEKGGIFTPSRTSFPMTYYLACSQFLERSTARCQSL